MLKGLTHAQSSMTYTYVSRNINKHVFLFSTQSETRIDGGPLTENNSHESNQENQLPPIEDRTPNDIASQTESSCKHLY